MQLCLPCHGAAAERKQVNTIPVKKVADLVISEFLSIHHFLTGSEMTSKPPQSASRGVPIGFLQHCAAALAVPAVVGHKCIDIRTPTIGSHFP
jgi:hypothetical protein